MSLHLPPKKWRKGTVPPKGQKKANAYDGKRINVTGLVSSKSGDVFIASQDVNRNFKTARNTYKDFIVMQFSNAGKFKKLYGIDTPAKGGIYNTTDPNMSPQYYGCTIEMVASESTNSVYWITSLVTQIDKYKEEDYLSNTVTYTFIPQEQMLISKIDVDKQPMEAIQTLGDGEKGRKQFYLRRDIRYVDLNGGQELLVIGEDRGSFCHFQR